jgi:maltose alpha-D-glucosyltransferase / alpha-amylase
MVNTAFGKDRNGDLRKTLPAQLPNYLINQRWFGGKARQILATEIVDVVSMPGGSALLLIVLVSYGSGSDEMYAIPVTAASEGGASVLRLPSDQGSRPIGLKDAVSEPRFLTALLQLIHSESTAEGEQGTLRGRRTSAYSSLAASTPDSLTPKALRAEQSNTSVVYGDKLILKLFRKLEEGINPDLEVGAFLTEVAHFKNIPQLAGLLEYQSHSGKIMAQGILQAFVPNQGDAWRYTLSSLGAFYEEVKKEAKDGHAAIPDAKDTRDTKNTENTENSRNIRNAALPGSVGKSLNTYSQSAKLLGRRTAEMHLALSVDSQNSAFAPEAFSAEYQSALQRSLVELTERIFGQLREKSDSLPVETRGKAEALSGKETEILSRFRSTLSEPLHALRTRIHGDYHLGQVLFTGDDFVIIDFEGEPARPLSERRLKRSPLQDVAGMLRSFHYAAFSPLIGADAMKPEEAARLSPWAEFWNARISADFLAAYFDTCGDAAFLPKNRSELQSLLELHLLEKAVYELGYELNNRPGWVGIPLEGIGKLLSS